MLAVICEGLASDGTPYAGIARDLDARLAGHGAGKDACYVRGRRYFAVAGDTSAIQSPIKQIKQIEDTSSDYDKEEPAMHGGGGGMGGMGGMDF